MLTNYELTMTSAIITKLINYDVCIVLTTSLRKTASATVIAIKTSHGWGNHPGKSGHGLTNILTLHTS